MQTAMRDSVYVDRLVSQMLGAMIHKDLNEHSAATAPGCPKRYYTQSTQAPAQDTNKKAPLEALHQAGHDCLSPDSCSTDCFDRSMRKRMVGEERKRFDEHMLQWETVHLPFPIIGDP
eukprot:GHVQ01039646.1.p1 GENE.GHVQ01039646.1~~GHVQ01039646.1.p1  ORF type:complete len:118 (+),score=14.76 GHVQ01039646.1:264-617(+)